MTPTPCKRTHTDIHPKVITHLQNMNALFGTSAGIDLISRASDLKKQSLLTFVTGLLFYAFGKAKDKKGLRADVVRHLALPDRAGLDREDLPPGLRLRAEQAILRQVPV